MKRKKLERKIIEPKNEYRLNLISLVSDKKPKTQFHIKKNILLPR